MTIGEAYNPLVAAALVGDSSGFAKLNALGAEILANNPDKCPDLADGIEAAKRNLDYYCQYFTPEEAAKVKAFYGLGGGYRGLDGTKYVEEAI